MNQKSFVKRILAVALSVIIVLVLLPLPTYAYPGDGGAILTSNDPGQYDMDGRPLLVYVTPNGGYVSRTSGGNGDSTQRYTATANNGWVFYQWRTYYQGPSSDSSNPNHTWDSEWCFSKPGDSETKPDLSSATIQVNREWDAKGTYYLYAIFKPNVTFSTGYNRVSISSPSSEFATAEKSTQAYINYNDTATFSAAMGGRTNISITVNGNSFTDFLLKDGWELVFSITITRPTSIVVNSRAKIQNVHFDPNGGTGTMSAESFNYGEAKELSANSFTRTGYIFAGWNTEADGLGISYTNQQSVTFLPNNDGDSITLYAQWTACTNHRWENGECADCGTACSHSGGTATCTEKAVCTVCAVAYGETLGHDWGDWISNDNGTHTRTCANDVTHTETGDCSGGTATCTEKAKCSVCTVEYGELAAHTYGTAWETDGTNHWHECSCGAKSEEAAHNGGTATCTEKAVCTVCGQPYGNTLGHDWGDWISNGNGTHTRTCANDASHTETQNCSGGTATCTEKAKCSICAVEYGELLAHTYEKGKCTVCEAVDPNHVPETSSPQTGDNSNLYLWLALLFISGGAVITLTVYDRKRRTAKH